jgi:hypothetical protein
MHVGIVFSQADSGTDPLAIRQFAIDAEAAGFHHLLAYDHILGDTTDPGASRLRRIRCGAAARCANR